MASGLLWWKDMETIKIKFSDLQKRYMGRIILLPYAKGSKTLAFAPMPSVENNMKCECGHSMWNATNFGGLVHFCPNRELEVHVTDFEAKAQ